MNPTARLLAASESTTSVPSTCLGGWNPADCGHENNPIELHLKSGAKIGGKVAFVGAHVMHLTSLTGMELFEATVTIADVGAIVVRSAK